MKREPASGKGGRERRHLVGGQFVDILAGARGAISQR